jgi:hypothetical protein
MNLMAKLLLNSLYGRFGMDDSFITTKFINKKDYLEFENKYKEGIKDIIDLGDNYLLQYKDPQIEFKSLLDNGTETHNVNIAIASAVTAYARIHMSQFKNNQILPRLFYSDTDSLYFEGPLPDYFVDDTELGKLKLVGIYDKAIFLAPKVYALKNNNTEIIKIKGLNKKAIEDNKITLNTLELLLERDCRKSFKQNKLFKNISDANFQVLNIDYTLKSTENKRNFIYNDENNLIGSRPYFLLNGEFTNKD